MKSRDLTKWSWLDGSMDNVGMRSSIIWRESLLGAKLIRASLSSTRSHTLPVGKCNLSGKKKR